MGYCNREGCGNRFADSSKAPELVLRGLRENCSDKVVHVCKLSNLTPRSRTSYTGREYTLGKAIVQK